MAEDPWEEIARPSVAGSVSARRVDANLPWSFFWAKDPNDKVALTLHVDTESTAMAHIPELRSIDVTLALPDSTGKQLLAFRLLDAYHQDIFLSLCKDIISATTRADSEGDAFSIALLRTWRWHHLLRGGRGTKLSREEQKGLLGELLVLERLLLPRMSAWTAIEAWRGPLGASRDFETSRLGIEAKACRGGANRHISITSESQLDESSVETLVLYVVQFDAAPDEDSRSVTLTEVVDRIAERLVSLDPTSTSIFETRLSAAGYRIEDDYSSDRWLEDVTRIYRVTGDFPRITPDDLRPGVSKVNYAISLADCDRFMVSVESLDKVLAIR